MALPGPYACHSIGHNRNVTSFNQELHDVLTLSRHHSPPGFGVWVLLQPANRFAVELKIDLTQSGLGGSRDRTLAVKGYSFGILGECLSPNFDQVSLVKLYCQASTFSWEIECEYAERQFSNRVIMFSIKVNYSSKAFLDVGTEGFSVSVMHPVTALIDAVGETYGAIDIRSVAIPYIVSTETETSECRSLLFPSEDASGIPVASPVENALSAIFETINLPSVCWLLETVLLGCDSLIQEILLLGDVFQPIPPPKLVPLR